MGIEENNKETVQKLSLPWLEDSLKELFKKEQITSDELGQIKYFSMRVDGYLIIEISLEEPPVPFTTPWGGDEWECCVLNGSQIQEYVDWVIENDYSKCHSTVYGFDTSPFSYEHEEYELSEEDIAKAKKFDDTLSEINYSPLSAGLIDDDEWDNSLVPDGLMDDEKRDKRVKFYISYGGLINYEEWEKWYAESIKAIVAELEKFPNIKVLRLNGGSYKDLSFVEKLEHLEVLELVEANFESNEGFDKLPKLKQLCCWWD